MNRSNQIITMSWINLITGIWLIAAPFVLGYSYNTPKTNDIWLGAVVGILALIRAFNPFRMVWINWVNVLAGIWLIIAPFVLRYSTAASFWNDVIVGIIVAAVAFGGAGVTVSQQTKHARV